MSRTGLILYEQHFLLSNQIVRFLVGLNCNKSLNNVVIRNFFILTNVFLYLFHQLYQCFIVTLDSQSSYNLLQNTLASYGISCTFGAINLQLSTIRDIVSYIKHDYKNLLDENELKITKKYTKMTKIYIIIFVSYLLLYGILMTIPTILSIFLYIYRPFDNVNIAYVVPVNANYSGFLRYGLLSCQIIALFAILIIACVIISLNFFCILHACTQFNILKFKIRQPFAKEEYIEKNWDNQTNQEESEWIINVIRRYTRVTKYVNLINKLSKNIYIIGIFLCMIMIFFDILYILELPVILQKNTSKILEFFVSICGSIIFIYINFHFGQMLIDHSTEAHKELCQVPIYILSKKNQRLLLLVAMRSIKPSELSIGGLFSSSHEIFAELMKKSFSFAMAYYRLIQST